MINVGITNSLNEYPLFYALENNIISHNFNLKKGSSKEIAEWLIQDEINIGLISALEYGRNPGKFVIIPDISTTAVSTFRNVLLFFNQSSKQFEKVAIVSDNPQDKILAQIIIQEKFLMESAFYETTGNLPDLLENFDAVLLRDLQSIRYRKEFPSSFNLVEEWNDYTQLPFVFSFWAGKIDYLNNEITELLKLSRDIGLKYLADISSKIENIHGLDWEDLYSCYSNDMNYNFTNDMINGINKFWEFLFFYGYIDYIPELHFYK